MDKISLISKVHRMLEKNIDYPYSKECIDVLEGKSNFSILQGIVMDHNHIYETYKTRSEIQKQITHAQTEGYDFLLMKMENFTESKVKIVGLETENIDYTIFSDEVLDKLIGILKAPISR